MFALLNTIAKATSRVEVSALTFGSNTSNVVIIPKPRPGSYGIPLTNDILMVDYGSAMSFRVKYCNLGLHKEIRGYHTQESFPRSILEDYFSENHDNPYALMYVIGRMVIRGDFTTQLTQAPPLVTTYDSRTTRAQAIARLLKEAQPMDSLFSRQIATSEVSQLIRTIDRRQFSHVGTYVGEGLTIDAGPNGVRRTSLAELGKAAHLALYRLRKPLSNEQQVEAIKFMNEQVGRSYNWVGVMEVFLRKKFRLNRRIPSVGDLLFSDAFQLITYV